VKTGGKDGYAEERERPAQRAGQQMKRILGIGSVVGVISVTAWLIYSLVIHFGNISPTIPKLEDAKYPKVEYPKVEYPKVEFPKVEYPKVEFPKVEYPKVEIGDPELPNQPPALPPPESPIDSSEPDSSFSPDCDPFSGMDLSLVILTIEEDISDLLLYLKTNGDVIPGLVPPDETQPTEYHALLGDFESNSCGLQGFDDRLYCMFTITSDMPGTVADFFLYRDACEEPAFTLLNVTIPALQDEIPQCNEELDPEECEAAGGTMGSSRVTASDCICP
jgi:hypothetical protein